MNTFRRHVFFFVFAFFCCTRSAFFVFILRTTKQKKQKENRTARGVGKRNIVTSASKWLTRRIRSNEVREKKKKKEKRSGNNKNNCRPPTASLSPRQNTLRVAVRARVSKGMENERYRGESRCYIGTTKYCRQRSQRKKKEKRNRKKPYIAIYI